MEKDKNKFLEELSKELFSGIKEKGYDDYEAEKMSEIFVRLAPLLYELQSLEMPLEDADHLSLQIGSMLVTMEKEAELRGDDLTEGEMMEMMKGLENLIHSHLKRFKKKTSNKIVVDVPNEN